MGESVAAQKLVERGVKMLVVACNTATANALPTLRATFTDIPIVGVVEPGARAAVDVSQTGHIMVIATEATIKSAVYTAAIQRLNNKAVVTSKACTLFVPMVEEGLMTGQLVEGLVHYYLDATFLSATLPKPDTIILGCTHFPLLKTTIELVVGPKVQVVDPASRVANVVAEKLRSQDLLTKNTHNGQSHFLTTDNQERFAKTGSLFLGSHLEAQNIELIDL